MSGRNGESKAGAKQPTGRKALQVMLEQARPQLQTLLPRYMTPERVVNLVLLAATKTPKLLECDPRTVVQSVMQAAQLGLEIGGPVPGAHLVPYFNKKVGGFICQMIPDYRGLIKLAIEAGSILSGDARLVYRGERFKVTYGTDPGIQHEPDFDAVDQGEDAITHVYFVAKLASGEMKFEVMTRKQVEAIRDRSKAGNDGPWKTDFGQMACKTVVKRGLKLVPMTSQLADAIEMDTRYETGAVTAVIPEIDTVASLSEEVRDRTRERLDTLRDRIGAGEAKVEDEPEQPKNQRRKRSEPEPSASEWDDAKPVAKAKEPETLAESAELPF